MDSVKAWVLSLCCAAVAGSLYHMMAPRTGTAKLFKFTVNLFFFCCLLIPLAGGGFDFSAGLEGTQSLRDSSAQGLQMEVEEQIRQDFSASVAAAAEELLRQNEINFSSVDVFINMEDKDGIVISEIRIQMDGNIAAMNKARRLIRENMGVQPEIRLPAGADSAKGEGT